MFAAVRCVRISSIGQMRAIENHGRRLDDASARRVDPARTSQNLAASPYSPEDPLAVVDAFKAFKATTGAVEAKSGAIGLHVLAIVSPELIREAGDLHDPNNPVNRRLFQQAQDWAKATFGADSLVAARLDVDEKGGGVVDLVVCPTAIKQGGRGRKPKLTISPRDALAKIQQEHGAKRSFAALQDSWTNHAREHVDPRLKRGQPKEETGRKHVLADALREADATAAAVLADARIDAEVMRRIAAEDAAETRLEAQRELDRLIAQRDQMAKATEQAKAWFQSERAKLEAGQRQLQADRQQLERAKMEAGQWVRSERADIEAQRQDIAGEREQLAQEWATVAALKLAYEEITGPLRQFAHDVKRWVRDFRDYIKPPERADQALDAANAILTRIDTEAAQLQQQYRSRTTRMSGPSPG